MISIRSRTAQPSSRSAAIAGDWFPTVTGTPYDATSRRNDATSRRNLAGSAIVVSGSLIQRAYHV